MAKESLYELTEQYAAVRDMLFDEDVDEQVINDTLASIEGAIEVKADNYAKIIREMNATAEMIKQEEVRLAARRKSLENRSAALKDRLEENMRFIDKKKFKTDLFSFNIQTNGGTQPLWVSEDISEIPMRFLVQADPEPNNTAIREYLKNHEVDWAKLLPRGESLRIR
ncbi:siphovirus Gp157 family protein [Clostridiaceae bacterium Marseille-Q4145]|nr:siphovirus Gp157 family protein [Clostridiaceae bacterium Marseille-Q4145]